MIELRCTVRGCESVLTRSDSVLRCKDGHCFDQAKGGYWNLTQPQDKKSSNPGDTDEAVLARHRWLQRGHMEGLVSSLKDWSVSASENGSIVDLGCGEGSFGSALFAEFPTRFCGIDLSKKAIRLAARGWPDATWVLANADRVLPMQEGCASVVVSLFGRRPVSEIARILRDDGILIIAVPGESDLIELREQVQLVGRKRSRWESIVEEMENAGLLLSQRKSWKHQVQLDASAIADALAMTYRAVRSSQQARLAGVETAEVTLSADLLLFGRS